MLRNGLSYSQASTNANRIARNKFAEAIETGKTIKEAQDIARVAYEKEMEWYERK